MSGCPMNTVEPDYLGNVTEDLGRRVYECVANNVRGAYTLVAPLTIEMCVHHHCRSTTERAFGA